VLPPAQAGSTPVAASQGLPADPAKDEERGRLIAALTASGATSSERTSAATSLLALELDPAQLDAIVQAFPERDRRDLASLVERTLRAPAATPLQWRNAARLAEQLSDPALAPALLDRLELALAQPPSPGSASLVKALRAALDSARRRIAELEAERLAQAGSEACAQQMDHAAPEVRRAALARLGELARRRGDTKDDALERARDRALERLATQVPGAPNAVRVAPDELRLLAVLAAELLPAGAAEVKSRWIDCLARAGDPETRLAWLAALRRLVRDQPDAEVAKAAGGLLSNGDSAQLVDAGLEALRFVGEPASFEAIVPWMAADGAGRAKCRQAAVAAAADLARRSNDPTFERRVLDALTKSLQNDPSGEVRLAAALGLSQLIESIADRPRGTRPIPALDVENLGRAFDALRLVLRDPRVEQALAEQCAKALCRVPGRSADAAQVLCDVLLTSDPSPAVRESLLRGLKELGEPAGLPAIVAALPKGGPSVEPDALGKAAYAAFVAVLQRADSSPSRVAVRLDAVAACLATNEPEWALQPAGQLLDRIAETDHDAARVAIRLAFGRAAARSRANETLERGWTALTAAAEDPRATPAQRQESRLRLIELAERARPLHAADGAAAAERLLADGVSGDVDRKELVKRCAALWLIAGEWSHAYSFLDRELDERDAATDLLVLKARAAARRDDAGGPRDAQRLLEMLVGVRGSGGRLAEDAADRAALTLALAQAYVAGARRDDARATLAALPPADGLPAELREQLEQLRRVTSG
jgi:hypothetical protein